MSGDDKTVIKRALRIMLRPLARLLMRHDISHSEFAEISKEVFVHAAHEDMALPGRKATVSRASVLTGLSRKEVARILGTGTAQVLPKLTPNRAARVVTGWLSDAAFCCRDGNPKPLTKEEFDQLIQQYSGYITDGAILDELMRLEVVSINNDKEYYLTKGGYVVSSDDFAEGFETLTKSATYLLNTGEHNLACKQETSKAYFQRQLTERNVPKGIVTDFKSHAGQRSMALLVELNQWLEQKIAGYQGDQSGSKGEEPTEQKDFVGLSIFYFESDEENSHEDRDQEDKR